MGFARRARTVGIQLLMLACCPLADRALIAQMMPVRVLASTKMLVTATVVNSCVVRTSPIDFGTYDPTTINSDSPLDAVGTVTVLCGVGQGAKVGLRPGLNAGLGDGTTRAMRYGDNLLGYDLYRDPDRTTVWTDQGNGLFSLLPERAPKPTNLTVYARIPAGQDVPPGKYMDVVTVDIQF
jgi:spore coat protein U domain-containing protein, fimbrial subunit CupE1/2/3/6